MTRLNPRTQTADGEFRGLCPGRTRLTVASGFETSKTRVRVSSEPGPIVSSLRAGARRIERQRTTVASVGLDQRARVAAAIRRNGRPVTRLGESCERPGNLRIHVGGRILRALAPGRYRVVVAVSSDRKPVRKSFPVRVS